MGDSFYSEAAAWRQIPKKLTHFPRIRTYLFHEFRSIILTRLEIRGTHERQRKMQFIKLQIGCLLVISYIEVTYIKATLKGKIPCNKRFDLLMAVAPWAVFFDGLTAWTVNHQKEEVKKLMETIERKGEE